MLIFETTSLGDPDWIITKIELCSPLYCLDMHLVLPRMYYIKANTMNYHCGDCKIRTTYILIQITLYCTMFVTGNHYKWDWPKSQFCMPDDSATVVWLRNLKVGYVNLFNFLQNTLKKRSFWKWEIRKLENVIFPSSAEPCRILQNSALVPQNSADHLGENHEILRISAEFCGTSAEFCRILHGSAELGKITFSNFLISHFQKLNFFNAFCRKLNK